jgi:hypothetical protein
MIYKAYFLFFKNIPNLYFVSAAAWAFIFSGLPAQSKKRTKKNRTASAVRSANSRSLPIAIGTIYQPVKIKILDRNFDRRDAGPVQTVLSDIWNHYFINIFSRMTVIFIQYDLSCTW